MSEQTDRRWLTIGLMMCVMAISFESYAVLTAMPAAARDLGNLSLYAWTFTAFVIAMTFSIVASGQFSDRYGPIQPMIWGFGIFAVGLVVAAVAPAMWVLLVARFTQGLGAGTMNVAVMVLIARAYDEAQRAKLMMWFSACWMLPAFVGPPLAGWIVQVSSWHFVFWSVLPFMAVGGLLVLRPLRHIQLAPEEPHELKKRLMVLAAAVAAGLALIQWAGQNLDLWSALWAAAGLAAVVFGLPPLLPKTIDWSGRGISGVVGARLFSAGAFFGAQSFLPLMLVEARGMETVITGITLTVGSVGWMLGALLQSQSWLSWRRDQMIIVGVVGIALGVAVLAVASYFPQSWLGLVMIAWIIAGFGMGLQNPSTSLAVMQLSEDAELGRNTSSLQVGESLGSSLFTGLAGAWFAHFHDSAELPFTFGGLMVMMVLVGLLAVGMAYRIGPVPNGAGED
ncbi:MAG: MFS transporter [Micropruina sp.]|uniref:MFS transporter n=1 Tax=Micropruina sp. TaxID=2737536 RepID=UPI0039E4FB59